MLTKKYWTKVRTMFSLSTWDYFSSNHMSEIIPGLFVGDMYAGQDMDLLRRNNIRHVINLAHPHVHPEYAQGIRAFCINIKDTPTANIHSLFDETYHFLRQGLGNGDGVLVHCMAGISRSATIALNYIIRTMNISAEEALKLMRFSRPIVNPNQGFWKQILDRQEEYLKHIIL